jgi:hypothetical protein
MSHNGGARLSASTESFTRDIEQARRNLPRQPAAIWRKTVAEYRRKMPSLPDVDPTQPNIWDRAKEDTHTEHVRVETWWLFRIRVYSREIILDSNL